MTGSLVGFPGRLLLAFLHPQRAAPRRRLLLTHTSRKVPAIADVVLEDDRLVELDAAGRITWELARWRPHTDFHLTPLRSMRSARAVLRSATTGSRRTPRPMSGQTSGSMPSNAASIRKT